MEIYVPIAHRLGISKSRWELDDLPEIYLEIITTFVEKIALRKSEREKFVQEHCKRRPRADDKAGTGASHGRAKHFFSIYKRLSTRKRP